MNDVFLLDEDRTPTPAEDTPGLGQLMIFCRVSPRNARRSHDMLASTVISLSLDELTIVVTEVSRAIFGQLAANLMLRTPEEVAALKEKIDQLDRALMDGGAPDSPGALSLYQQFKLSGPLANCSRFVSSRPTSAISTPRAASRSLTMPRIPPPEVFFEAAQAPSAWLRTAENLAEAAETIATSQKTLEDGYQRASAAASAEAEASESGVAEITHVEPNYLPAGLLYGFAMENALKGLIIAKKVAVVSGRKLDARIKTHDLVELAKYAGFTLNEDERDILNRMSIVVEWAGRYPVASDVQMHKRLGRMPVVTNRFLNWISWQDVFRGFVERVRTELEQAAGGPRTGFGVVVSLKD